MRQVKQKVFIPEQSVGHINILEIPDYVFEMACPVLNKAIHRALRDPEERKDYERWKAEREFPH